MNLSCPIAFLSGRSLSSAPQNFSKPSSIASRSLAVRSISSFLWKLETHCDFRFQSFLQIFSFHRHIFLFDRFVLVVAQKLHEAKITEQDLLLLIRHLVRTALFNISYIRGLFPEEYFRDEYVPALEMQIKKLKPMDAESCRLIDAMEKGVFDALQKKNLKTHLFCVCESVEGPMTEQYACNLPNVPLFVSKILNLIDFIYSSLMPWIIQFKFHSVIPVHIAKRSL